MKEKTRLEFAEAVARAPSQQARPNKDDAKTKNRLQLEPIFLENEPHPVMTFGTREIMSYPGHSNASQSTGSSESETHPGAVHINGVGPSHLVDSVTTSRTPATITEEELDSNGPLEAVLVGEEGNDVEEQLLRRLQEAEAVAQQFRRQQEQRILVEAIEVGNNEASNQPARKNLGDGAQKKRVVWGALMLLVLVVTGVVTGVLISAKKKTPTQPQLGGISVNGTVSYIELVSSVGEHVTDDLSVFGDSSTVQYQTMDWLANNDTYAPASERESIERYVVALLYFATNGPSSWFDQNNFLSAVPVCQWHFFLTPTLICGVLCDFDDNVFELVLDVNGLEGTIPTEIGLLTHLNNLNLGENNLIGTIPSQLGLLTGLEGLGLSFNQLSGSIPSELGHLTQLQILNLGITDLDGSLPTEFVNLIELTELMIEGTSLTGNQDALCNSRDLPFDVFMSDCRAQPHELDCSCCTHCCQGNGQNCVEQ